MLLSSEKLPTASHSSFHVAIKSPSTISHELEFVKAEFDTICGITDKLLVIFSEIESTEK